MNDTGGVRERSGKKGKERKEGEVGRATRLGASSVADVSKPLRDGLGETQSFFWRSSEILSTAHAKSLVGFWVCGYTSATVHDPFLQKVLAGAGGRTVHEQSIDNQKVHATDLI
jgi:hypothetical protein